MLNEKTPTEPSASEAESSHLCTAQEVAVALRLNPQTVYRLAKKGEIPSLRIGRKTLRFDLNQVRDALAAQSEREQLPVEPSPLTSSLSFVRLDELQRTGTWLTPATDVVLERFAVAFPSSDLTRLAYERETV